MAFSFGGSKTDSFSRGSSFSQDRSQSGSVSGGRSESGSTSEQAIAFEDVFARLFGGAEGAAAGLDPSLLTNAANQLFGAGTGFLGSLGGDAGTAYLEERLSGDNAVLEEQIDLLQSDLGDLFREELNPAITSEAVAGGQLGGGRQGVAQGIATEAVGDLFTQGATALRAGDIAARDAAASTIAQNNLVGAQTGLASLPGLLGIAETGTFASLAPSERLAAILGDPTVLTRSESFGTAEDFARAFASSFGFSRSETESRSKGRAFSFGPGD